MGKIALKISKAKNWIKAHKKEAFILGVILLLGAFLRLYRIDEYLTFLGDEGRDVIIVRRLLMYGDIILVGPGTSIGNMYLGPLYYYLMAPFLFLFNYSPVGPAVMVALLGILTVFLVWYMGREWFGSKAALVASLFYAISPTVIIFSKASWNPNIMPFFALVCVYSIWKVSTQKNYKWLVPFGISFAFVLQSHYLGLLLAPLFLFYLVLTFFRNGKFKNKEYMKYSLVGFFVFSLLMSPLVIFDARHGWRNAGAIKKFFTERQTTVSARPWNALPNMYPRFEKINTRLLGGRNEEVGKFVSVILLLGLGWVFIKRITNMISAFWMVVFWFGLGVVGLGLYKQEIYDHYYGFLFAAPFLLLGIFSQQLLNSKSRILKFGSLIGLGALVVVNFMDTPVKYPPNRQLQRSEAVSKKIIDESKNEKFNLAVIAERNYEGAYQYFLESWGSKFTSIDPVNTKDTITSQLFVVCELPPVKCDPTHNPKAEVANFGWSKIDQEWNVEGITLYKLIHSQ